MEEGARVWLIGDARAGAWLAPLWELAPLQSCLVSPFSPFSSFFGNQLDQAPPPFPFKTAFVPFAFQQASWSSFLFVPSSRRTCASTRMEFDNFFNASMGETDLSQQSVSQEIFDCATISTDAVQAQYPHKNYYPTPNSTNMHAHESEKTFMSPFPSTFHQKFPSINSDAPFSDFDEVCPSGRNILSKPVNNISCSSRPCSPLQ